MLLPRIGQTIKLTFAGSSEDPRLHTYKSRVVDIKDEVASIELPTNEETGRTGLFQAGEECEVWYVGEDGSRYEFHSSIVGRQRDHIPVLFLQLPSKESIQRTQRRNYLRIDSSLDIAVKLDDPIRRYHFLARTVDISGGGLSFTCEESYRLQEKDQVHIWISMPNKTGPVQHAYALLEVVRQKPAEKKGLHQWISGKFVQISEQDRAKVVRACYERQLELRKKGVAE
ncbi:flagellar brake protein [Brevibacillus choshinensis]|uniref:Flagellar brake domain-containing protein n=1 Tax=Brevibacillus choshinensis TaxID=54911 RepID=A0ABX7FVS2_BRECH|nr:flagellar brake domain-containing protein [Brevibacillus choshinensis]QRG69885.1 flagellar brake domain-containing protein [Brevibacillus choshinensis]